MRSHGPRHEVSARVLLPSPQCPVACSLIISHKLARNPFECSKEGPPILIIHNWVLLGRESVASIRFSKGLIIPNKVNLLIKLPVWILSSPPKLTDGAFFFLLLQWKELKFLWAAGAPWASFTQVDKEESIDAVRKKKRSCKKREKSFSTPSCVLFLGQCKLNWHHSPHTQIKTY